MSRSNENPADTPDAGAGDQGNIIAAASVEPVATPPEPPAPPEPTASTEPPAPPEPQKPGKKSALKKIKNKSCPGVSLVAATGEPVEFDENGVAECLEADYLHLIGIPGYDDVK